MFRPQLSRRKPELDAASELRLLRLRGGLPMRDSESIFKAKMLQVPGLADEKRQ